MPTETADLKIFVLEYRRAGCLDSTRTFRVGESAEHARELEHAELSAKFSGDSFELSDAREVSSNELPENANLFEKLNRQRAALLPPPPESFEGPLFMFWLKRGGSRQRYLTFSRDESRETARTKAESYAAEHGFTVAGGVKQFTLESIMASDQLAGRSDSELFGKLQPADRVQLAEYLRDKHAEEWAAWCENLASRCRAGNFPDRHRIVHSCPRPNQLTQSAFNELAEQERKSVAELEAAREPRSESAAERRERLERRRERIHASV